MPSTLGSVSLAVLSTVISDMPPSSEGISRRFSASASLETSSSRTGVSALSMPNSSRGASSNSLSRNGFSSSICSISWLNSRVESWSRRIDCCNCGVRARCWETRRESPCFMASPASHSEMFAEINAAHIRVLDNFKRRALRQHTTFADDASVVTNTQGLAHVMVGDQHTNTTRF